LCSLSLRPQSLNASVTLTFDFLTPNRSYSNTNAASDCKKYNESHLFYCEKGQTYRKTNKWADRQTNKQAQTTPITADNLTRIQHNY